MTHDFDIVVERGTNGFGASVPDLPGCVAVAESEAEVRDLVREAIEIHLAGMRESNEPIPQPAARIDHVNVPIGMNGRTPP